MLYLAKRVPCSILILIGIRKEMIMQIFKYDVEKARKLNMEYNGKVFVKTCIVYTLLLCLTVFTIVGGCILIGLSQLVTLGWLMVILGVIFSIVVLVKLIVSLKPKTQSAQSAFVLDEGILYHLLFIGEQMVYVGSMAGKFASVSYNVANQFEMQAMAQDDKMIEDLIDQHKRGIKTYSSFDGEGVKITEMKKVRVEKETEKEWHCTYVDNKGKERKKRIVKAFDIDLNSLHI